VAIGRNYAEHIKELNNTAPKEPFFFLKPTVLGSMNHDDRVCSCLQYWLLTRYWICRAPALNVSCILLGSTHKEPAVIRRWGCYKSHMNVTHEMFARRTQWEK
ncbi:hypothetical protein B0H13DRAFT_1633541, partial [Mycena leptocephala]